MIRNLLFACVCSAFSLAAAAEPLPESAKVGQFYAGCQAYTFKAFDLMTALEMIAKAGGKTVEFFPGHQLSKDDPKTKFDHNTTAEQRAAVKAKLKELGLTPVGYGVIRLKNDEAECRKVFEFCKDMDVGIVVSEPAEDAFDLIEKLVREFDIKMAIHNHPKKPLDRSYRYWDPEYVLSVVKDRDSRMGACADIGHWVRSGVKPTDAIKVLKGRIFDSHVKDLEYFGVREAKDRVWGTGVSDIPAVLNLYAEQGFMGPLDVEWEKDWETSLPDVTKCLAFVKNFKPSKADPAAQKETIKTTAEKSGVDARLDQSYANNANPKQMVDLFLPKKRNSEKPLPVVALIHGGGWIHGDRAGYAAAAIQLARTGDYAAVTVGYRLTNEAFFPEQIYDCKAAIRWIRGHAKEYNLDPDRIGVMGSSAGGHLSSLLGTSGDVRELEGSIGSYPTLSSRVQCVSNLCGPEDFTKAIMFDAQGKPVVDDPAVVGLLAGTYEAKHAEAVAASPITYVSRDDPPFVTFHGDADKRVAFANATSIDAALKKAGVSSLLVPITGGGHGSVGHPEVPKRSKAFFDIHLRGIKENNEVDTTPIAALPEVKK
jgi:acetyl esterase/lipase